MELVTNSPEQRATFLTEKAELSKRLGNLAARQLLLTDLLREVELETEACAERIGAINDYMRGSV